MFFLKRVKQTFLNYFPKVYISRGEGGSPNWRKNVYFCLGLPHTFYHDISVPNTFSNPLLPSHAYRSRQNDKSLKYMDEQTNGNAYV